MTIEPTLLPRYLGPLNDSQQSLARLLRRRVPINQQVPAPPRGLKISAGSLVWENPNDMTNVTHFLVRVDSEHTQPVRQVSAKQLSATGFSGTRFFVTSYNATTGLESTRAVVNHVTPITLNGTLSQSQRTMVVVTNPASPYTPNVSAGGDFTFEISINTNVTINVPTGAMAGQNIRFRILPDGTHVATFPSYIGGTNYGMDATSGTYSDFDFECRNSDAKPALAARPLTGITWP